MSPCQRRGTESYRQSTSEPAIQFSWMRPEAPCEWHRDYELKWPDAVHLSTRFHDDPAGPWLLTPAHGNPYEPLRQNRDLHLEFARLPLGEDDASLEALAAFATRYGRLGVSSLPIKPASTDSRARAGEHHADWRRAIRRIGGLVELLDAYRSADIDRVRQLVSWSEDGQAVDLVYRWPGDAETTQVSILREEFTLSPDDLAQFRRWCSSSLDHERYLEPLEYFLYREINESLGEHLSPQLRPKSGFELRCDSLLGALWVLLAEQLSGVSEPRREEFDSGTQQNEGGVGLSEMMVLGFESELEADQFGEKLAQMQKDMIVQLEDAAQVVRDPDGKPHVKHGHRLVGAGAMGGAFWGMLFGLLFFMPFLGMALGAGMGALFGKLGKTGLDSRVLEQMGDAVPPGKAGWFLIIKQLTEDKFMAAVEGTNAKLVRSNLSVEQEEELRQAFGAGKQQQ